MIGKAQTKFIAIIMSIILGVFAIILLFTGLTLQDINNKTADRSINDVYMQYSYFGHNVKSPNSLVIKFVNKVEYQLISFDSNCFTEESISTLVSKVVTKPYPTGRISNISYKIFRDENVTVMIAIDLTDSINVMSETMLKTILTLLALFFALFFIVFLISFNVFEPIKDAFIKQKQFVSNASHELKTPLTIISANTDVLKQSQPDNKWLNNISSQNERLETLITDMLEMAKLDENKPQIIKEEFDLSDEVIKSVLPFDSLAFEKGKILDCNVVPNILYKGDRHSVKKIINILLDNAIKYSFNEGIIKVSLYKKNGKTILSVFNTGSNVPANQANKVFERFYRVDNSRSRESGGSGLGLSIAKSIADTNKWKIQAVSRPGEHMIISVIF